MTRCTCGWEVVGDRPIKCPRCGEQIGEVRYAVWPPWARWVAKHRKPNESGVGDTVERLLASVGGRVYKKILADMGVNCGCGSRQESMNMMYRYANLPS